MKPGDYIIRPYAAHEASLWRITGVYYGAVGQENLVGLVAINRKTPCAHGVDIHEMLVPLELVEPYLAEARHD